MVDDPTTSPATPARPDAAAGKPKYPRGEITIALAVAAAGLGGVGLLVSAAPSLIPLGAVLAGLGILLGLGGVALGLAAGRRGPAVAAGACASFAILMLIIVLTQPLGRNAPSNEAAEGPSAAVPAISLQA